MSRRASGRPGRALRHTRSWRTATATARLPGAKRLLQVRPGLNLSWTPGGRRCRAVAGRTGTHRVAARKTALSRFSFRCRLIQAGRRRSGVRHRRPRPAARLVLAVVPSGCAGRPVHRQHDPTPRTTTEVVRSTEPLEASEMMFETDGTPSTRTLPTSTETMPMTVTRRRRRDSRRTGTARGVRSPWCPAPRRRHRGVGHHASGNERLCRVG